MNYTDQYKTDFLWKISQSVGMSSLVKQVFEESIRDASLPIPSKAIWTEDSFIEDPPVENSKVVLVDNLVLTPDLTSETGRIFVAANTYGDPSTRLSMWIPPQYGIGYQVQLYEDDGSWHPTLNPTGGLGTQIFTVDPIDWMFFPFGLLHCLVNPESVGKTLPLHLRGYRYVGLTGLPTGIVDAHFEYTVGPGTPQSLWTIAHNLGKKPSVHVLDIDGDEVDYDNLNYVDQNNLTLQFLDPVSGTAYLD